MRVEQHPIFSSIAFLNFYGEPISSSYARCTFVAL